MAEPIALPSGKPRVVHVGAWQNGYEVVAQAEKALIRADRRRQAAELRKLWDQCRPASYQAALDLARRYCEVVLV